jgi:hypothetical protein
MGIVPVPAEANPISIIHSYAVLAGTVAFESFEVVAWRNAKFVQFRDSFKLRQLSQGYSMD